MDPKWFGPHLAYTMAKYGMSMCVLGMAEQFKGKIAVNALWPKTSIATAAVQNLLGGDGSMKVSRSVDIMADSAYEILSQPKTISGHFYTVHYSLIQDEEILKSKGINDFSKYRLHKDSKE